MIDYTLTRSKRRTVGIYIRGGGVEVRAPKNLAKATIDALVAGKADWIREKLAQQATVEERRAGFAPAYGSSLLYRGREYPILAGEGEEAAFDGQSFRLPPGLTPAQIKAAAVPLYRSLAEEHLTALTWAVAGEMGVAPASVKVGAAKTRWGSCSGRRAIRYSWRLIMAEDSVIRYVTVHELAHLIEMNHSPRFWAIVGRFVPTYQTERAKLRALERRLAGENWA